MLVRRIALLALVHITLGDILPESNSKNVVQLTTTSSKVSGISSTNQSLVAARRSGKKKKNRSTSSSSGERIIGEESAAQDSLGIDDSSSSDSKKTDSDEKAKTRIYGKKAWRKWHRLCTPCPQDMIKKWRDPTIKWICGGYQRARRSFKSECMMHYRNCQDGTMFTKLHDHRCSNDTVPGHRFGKHFFYDYRVVLVDDSSSASSSSDDTGSTTDTDDSSAE